MAIGNFVDGEWVDRYASGDLLSEDTISRLHCGDFMQVFGAEMFRRLFVAQQATVVRARAEPYPAKHREPSRIFEALLGTIHAV